MCMGVVTSVGGDRPSRSMPGIAGCSCDPGAPADPSPFHQASSGASIRSHTGLRLQLGAVRAAPHGRSTKARDGSALQTTQRSSAARLKSAYGRRGSVEDGSMRRSGFALVARAALYGSSGAGAGHDCERLLRARKAPVQLPACLRPKDAVASAHASQLVDTTRRAVVNPPLTAPNSRSHIQMESKCTIRYRAYLGLDIPSVHLCFGRIQIRTAVGPDPLGDAYPYKETNGPPRRTDRPTLRWSDCCLWSF